ncbi:MAG: alanine--tRNA ligase [Cyanobacteria bacterium REEB444]|nr:alanine--tRNA ligase [Cyanobacteria bacterium REEB444]
MASVTLSSHPITGTQIRQTFIDFYQARQHQPLPSASLVPEDPTVLLTIAGMLPFKPIFLGQRVPEYRRATTSQKCIRTNDIENVGRTARHHTFFEMLGNFSFGDYFKTQAIAWAWELSTDVFKLPPERLVVSVFEEDEEAFVIWRDHIGVPDHRIKRMGTADNFWVSGPTGPCGPCSELYYDFHPEWGEETIDLEDDSRFIEFYNLVFMQYNRDVNGQLTALQSQSIDTGMGLERMAQILQQVPNNYETDLIFPIIETAAVLAGIDYKTCPEVTRTSLKVIGDHVRAVVNMIADGITAANMGRGYILRRLIRRVVRHGRLIGISGEFTGQVAETAIALAEDVYPNLRERAHLIHTELHREESQFLRTLERGEKLLEEIISGLRHSHSQEISGFDAFTLYDTYGFPLELTAEIAAEAGLTVDSMGFETQMEQQRQRARSAHEAIDLTTQASLDNWVSTIEPTQFDGYTKGTLTAEIRKILVNGRPVDIVQRGEMVQLILNRTPFYAESGGQVGDHGWIISDHGKVYITDVQKESNFFIHLGTVDQGQLVNGIPVTAQIDWSFRRRTQANHTATHLLQAALKQIVDPDISQAGSLVDGDRLRFDFVCPRSLLESELEQIETLVNTWIVEAHEAEVASMPIAEARNKGAIAMFGEKYGEHVRVVDFPGVSMELCGGTHVHNTAEIGVFKIIAETGVAAGVRRIEAVAGQGVLGYLTLRDRVVRDLSDRFKVKPEEIPERITALQTELKMNQKQLELLRTDLAIAKTDGLLATVEEIHNFKLIVALVPGVSPEALKAAAERLLQKISVGAVVLGSSPEVDKVSLVAAFSPEVTPKGLHAGQFIGGIAKKCGGGGGGKPNLAQAGGRDVGQLPLALAEAKAELVTRLSAGIQ